ncbi:hypothetical protein K435DRAFT_795123 [Dendrothele bispora CBS 962.96]|uniref:FAD-binding domain-containing protein n=1 Tax=Dendrothele bispora (strain CBS 962.96) TaxID=1314807 RepID=A0A4S8M9Z2_DENBC|nr:hypothetical protein K435DRAFT_795123 [Dendrothele bispora CBS 962.96]
MSQALNGSDFFTNFGPQNYEHGIVIVGAGPAGMMLAYCLTKMGIKPLIVDSNLFVDHEFGRGDGLVCRTLEVMENLQVYEEIAQHSMKLNSVAHWSIGENPSVKNITKFVSPDMEVEAAGLVVRQGVVEQVLTKRVEENSEARVLRPWTFQDADIENSGSESYVNVTLRSMYGETRQIRTRYLIGCDGGKSQVRRVLRSKYGVTFDGQPHYSVWAVVDVLSPSTNFPDTGKLAILETRRGTIMTIPREPIHGKECLRIYGEAPKMEDPNEDPKVEDVIKMIREAFHPYTITWDEINWFAVYRTGQRIVSKYDVDQRIFLAGDAAHIHSPKAGQGMNTSMQDTHNLAMKLAFVEKGFAKPEILATYNLERRFVASQLLAMDEQLIELFTKHSEAMKNSADNKDAAIQSINQLHTFQRRHATFQAGVSITYAESVLVKSLDPESDASSQALLSIGGQGLIPGRRLVPAVVTRYYDGLSKSILDATIPFDGRFTVFLCLGDLLSPGKLERVEQLKKYITREDGFWNRFIKRHDPTCQCELKSSSNTTNKLFPRSTVHPILRLAAVTTTEYTSVPLALRYEELFRPKDSQEPVLFGPKMLFCDTTPAIFYGLDRSADMQPMKPIILTNPLHQKWDVPEEVGSAVVLRPDGHVGAVVRDLLGREKFSEGAWNTVEEYFARFLVL